MVHVGDRVRVEARRVGAGTREGIVVDTRDRIVRVHWSTGEETSLAPAAGALTVIDSPSERQRRR